MESLVYKARIELENGHEKQCVAIMNHLSNWLGIKTVHESLIKYEK